jgi:hypothetical protein
MIQEKMSRLLVIDGSIARSAGETTHPISRSCREAMVNILSICHKMAMTDDILVEWKKHESNFARKWRRTMVAKKKVIKIDEFELQCRKKSVSELKIAEQRALEKDMHLLKGACAADGIIITRDEEIIRIWEKCGKNYKTPMQIKWINPAKEGIDPFNNL